MWRKILTRKQNFVFIIGRLVLNYQYLQFQEKQISQGRNNYFHLCLGLNIVCLPQPYHSEHIQSLNIVVVVCFWGCWKLNPWLCNTRPSASPLNYNLRPMNTVTLKSPCPSRNATCLWLVPIWWACWSNVKCHSRPILQMPLLAQRHHHPVLPGTKRGQVCFYLSGWW